MGVVIKVNDTGLVLIWSELESTEAAKSQILYRAG